MTENSFFKPKLGLVGLLSAAGAVATVASIASLAGRYFWMLDLASHFRVQYCITLAIIALGLVATRSFRKAAVFGSVAVFNLAFVIPLYTGAPTTSNAQRRHLSAMLINVHTSNTNHDAVLDAIARHDPDIVVVQEANRRWVEVLRALDSQYPYTFDEPRDDNFGIALLSKQPPLEMEVIDIASIGVPSILATFELEAGTFSLLGTHALPPVSSRYAEMRDRHLAAIPALTAELEDPVVVLGDLNASPWSYHFRKLLRDSGLRDASRGRGFQPTWPAHLFPLRIPIDHCLHSPDITIIDEAVGVGNGSDHFPVIVTFALP